MKKQILSVMLAVVLMLSVSAGAMAESSISLTDTTLHVGDQAYAIPVSVAALTEQGVNVPNVTGLQEGQYYPSVGVDNGINAFTVKVSYLTSTEDPYWVTGITWGSEDYAGYAVGGMVLGETTREQIIEACGADRHGKTYEGEELIYYAWNMNYSWYLTFDGEKPESKLIRITMDDNMVSAYGEVNAAKAGVADSDLPEAADMDFTEFILDGKHYAYGVTVQDLLDDGWVMPETQREIMVEARRGSRLLGDTIYMYNGVSMVKVRAFNTSEVERSLTDCIIESVSADTALNSSIVCSGGLANGVSTYAEAVAILGEPSKTEEGENGAREVTFGVLHSMEYVLTVDANDVVTAITVGGLI